MSSSSTSMVANKTLRSLTAPELTHVPNFSLCDDDYVDTLTNSALAIRKGTSAMLKVVAKTESLALITIKPDRRNGTNSLARFVVEQLLQSDKHAWFELWSVLCSALSSKGHSKFRQWFYEKNLGVTVRDESGYCVWGEERLWPTFLLILDKIVATDETRAKFMDIANLPMHTPIGKDSRSHKKSYPTIWSAVNAFLETIDPPQTAPAEEPNENSQ